MTGLVLPMREATDGRALQIRLAQLAALALVTLMFAALLIGERPFAADVADKAAISESGSAFNRQVIFASFACGALIATVLADRVIRLAGATWPAWLLVAWCALSFLWASSPGLVLRRAFAFALVYATLLVLVAAARRAEDMLWPLVLVFSVVVLLSAFAWILLPAVSWSPIGETGIFDNKNSAGSMTMLAIVLLNGAVIATGRGATRAASLAVMLVAWAFLLATRSKTSIGLAAVMTLLAPTLYMVAGARPATRLAVLLVAFAAGLLALVLVAGAGHDDRDLRLILFGDLTFTGRTEIWQHLTLEIARRPWLGHGFGSFWDTGALLNPIRSAPPAAWFMDAQLINTAHNGFIDVWLQNGLVGLLLAGLLVLRCLWLLAAEAAAHRAAERAALVTAWCVAFCLVLNNNLESYLFRTGDPLGYLFVFLLFHAEAARQRRRNRA